MARYVLLEFQDEDTEFADQFLEFHTPGNSEFVTYARVVGEVVQYYDVDDMYTDPRYKVITDG